MVAIAVDIDDRGRLAQCGTDASKSFLIPLAVDVRADAPVEKRDAAKSVVGIMDDRSRRRLFSLARSRRFLAEAPRAVQYVRDTTSSYPRLAQTIVYAADEQLFSPSSISIRDYSRQITA